MTIHEAVAHHSDSTRMFAKRLKLFGAIVANRWSTDYLATQVVEEVPAQEEYVPVDMPGRRAGFCYL